MTNEGNSGINRMDIREFREFGYLQEVNRRFFHRLGLALEVVVEPGCGECGHNRSVHDAKCVKRIDDPNRDACGCLKFVPVERLGGIWDYRVDPEGMVFSDGVASDKANRVQQEFDRIGETRHAALGYTTQPVGPTPKRLSG